MERLDIKSGDASSPPQKNTIMDIILPKSVCVNNSAELKFYLSILLLTVVSRNQQRIPARVLLLGPTSSMPITKQAASTPAIENPTIALEGSKLRSHFRHALD